MESEREGADLSLGSSVGVVWFFDPPVVSFVRTGFVNLDDDEDVLEMRSDGLGSEGQGARLLKHDCHDVIADVSLP